MRGQSPHMLRKLARIVLNAPAALSLLLCAAVVVLWARSPGRDGWVGWLSYPAGTQTVETQMEVMSHDARLQFSWGRVVWEDLEGTLGPGRAISGAVVYTEMIEVP